MAYSGKQVVIMIYFAVCGMHYAVQFNAYHAIAYSGLGNSALCIAVQPMAYSGKQVVIMGAERQLKWPLPEPAGNAITCNMAL